MKLLVRKLKAQLMLLGLAYRLENNIQIHLEERL
jgi:hypothetical protein